ncbi:MAG TPA: leukotoxin LktA family filamentous adhesin, partial [Limnochordia bacterium]
MHRWARRLRKPIAFVTLWLFLGQAAFAQSIVADGKTQTLIEVAGKVTDISTSTLVDGNAFNSFSEFSIDSGNVVNLHVPSSASNLLNLVHSDTSYIHGMLNSIKDGQIGGNVFFLNPHGFVVGSEGVVNVGTLTVLTPTQEFMDEFFAADGGPSETAVAQVLDGTVPIDENGLISIQGEVNAIGDIGLRAGTVTNEGTIASGAVFDGSAVDFSDVVNVAGMESGAGLSVESGKIEIVATDKVANSGTIVSEGTGGTEAGSIAIEAG